MPILGKKGYFSPFRAFLGPWGLPAGSRGGCFYINPSRRGPVAPPGVLRRVSPVQGRESPRVGA